MGLQQQVDLQLLCPLNRRVELLTNSEDALLGRQAVTEFGLGVTLGGNHVLDAQ